MFRILKTFTQTLEFELVADFENPSIVRRKCVGVPKFLPFYLSRLEVNNFPYPYRQITEDDFQRRLICVSTGTALLFWTLVYKLEYLNWRCQGFVYYFLRDKVNQGVGFIPDTELVGGWLNMFRKFLIHKLRSDRT